MAKRKVGYYYLELKLEEDQLPVLTAFKKVMNYVCEKNKVDRIKDMLNENICFVDDFQQVPDHQELYKIIFKTAKHSYRAPLLDKNTAVERENPKTMNEGESYKTHMVIDFNSDVYDGLICTENAQNLLSMQQFVQYLNHFLSFYNAEVSDSDKIRGTFCQYVVSRTDFRETLNNMSRVSVATLVIDKSILGGAALDYSNQTTQIQEDVQLTIKAVRAGSIKNSVYNFLQKLNNGNNPIKRMKVQGKMANNNDCFIDTEMFAKKEYIEVSQNSETGEYDSASVFSHLIYLVYGN